MVLTLGGLLQSQRAQAGRKSDRSVRQWERKWSQSHKRLSICGRHEACQPSNGHVVMWEGAGMPLRFLTTTNKKEKRPPHICWDTRDFVWHHGQVLRGRDCTIRPTWSKWLLQGGKGKPLCWSSSDTTSFSELGRILPLLKCSLSPSTLLTFGAG